MYCSFYEPILCGKVDDFQREQNQHPPQHSSGYWFHCRRFCWWTDFSFLQSSLPKPQLAGAVQAGCLLVVTLGTLLYTIKKDKIPTLSVTNDLLVVVIGFGLGTMSSLLGIGGGPINLVVLFYFFSMDTKTASQNSLFIILFSQISNLFTTLATNSVPDFDPVALTLMVLGGIGGGIIGRALSKKMDNSHTDKLLIGLMVVIMFICGYNIYRFVA